MSDREARMEAEPAGVAGEDVASALWTGWGIEVRALHYLPVGFGGYHWAATFAGGDRFFVTLASVADDAALRALRLRLDVARRLSDSGLDFVVAPLPTTAGESVVRLTSQYALAVYPYVDGTFWSFGDVLPRRTREALLELLGTLHRATPEVRDLAPVHILEVADLVALRDALGRLGEPWDAGPYAEPARRLLSAHAADVVALVERFDALAARAAVPPEEYVVTHGEPHGGNLCDTGDGLRLVDWDTVALAAPERDLWMLGDDVGNAERLTLYRLRWRLDDIASYTAQLRSPHSGTADEEAALRYLAGNLAEA